MGDAAGQSADGFHFLGMAQTLLAFPERRFHLPAFGHFPLQVGVGAAQVPGVQLQAGEQMDQVTQQQHRDTVQQQAEDPGARLGAVEVAIHPIA